MASSATRRELLGLYRGLLRAASGFSTPNMRQYFADHIRDDFRAVSRGAAPQPHHAEELLHHARTQLAVLQRQAAISRMYASHTAAVAQPTPARAPVSK